MIRGPIKRHDWLRLPSGAVVSVCRVGGEAKPNVEVRYLDKDGVQSTGSYTVTLQWLHTYATKVASETCQ